VRIARRNGRLAPGFLFVGPGEAPGSAADKRLVPRNREAQAVEREVRIEGRGLLEWRGVARVAAEVVGDRRERQRDERAVDPGAFARFGDQVEVGAVVEEPGREVEGEDVIVGVEQPFDVPLIDLDTGEVDWLDVPEEPAAAGEGSPAR